MMEAPIGNVEVGPNPFRGPAAAQPTEGLELRGPFVPAGVGVLTPEALAFVAKLERRFGPRRRSLLARRRDVQAKLDLGWRPDFLESTADLRAESTESAQF
jgi:malate synthase